MARISGFHSDGTGRIRFLTPVHGYWWSGARLSLLLIIVNFAFWLIFQICDIWWKQGGYMEGSVQNFAGILSPYVAISAEGTIQKFRLWTLITYMFVHYDFMHFFWNNLLVLFFAPQLERDFGSKKFITFYLICGLGAAIISILYKTIGNVTNPTVGASGAIMGILVAYGMSYPHQTVYVFGMFPVKMKTLMIVIILIQFAMVLQQLNQAGCTTDYFAHIGGLLTGYLYFKLPGIRKGGPGIRKKLTNWRGEDSDEERSYYLEV